MKKTAQSLISLLIIALALGAGMLLNLAAASMLPLNGWW